MVPVGTATKRKRMKKLFTLAAMLMVAVTMMAATIDECFEKAEQVPGVDATELGADELKMAAAFMPQMADVFNACSRMRTVQVEGAAVEDLINCFACEIDDYELFSDEGDLMWMRMSNTGRITGLLILSKEEGGVSVMELVTDMSLDDFGSLVDKMSK